MANNAFNLLNGRWSTQVVESAARWKRWWSKFSAYGPGLPAIDQQGHQH